MDYNEMLFAVHVRKLAQDMRNGDLRAFLDEQQVPIAEMSTANANWAKENPIEDYIPYALRAIRTTAEHIRSLE